MFYDAFSALTLLGGTKHTYERHFASSDLQLFFSQAITTTNIVLLHQLWSATLSEFLQYQQHFNPRQLSLLAGHAHSCMELFPKYFSFLEMLILSYFFLGHDQ